MYPLYRFPPKDLLQLLKLTVILFNISSKDTGDAADVSRRVHGGVTVVSV